MRRWTPLLVVTACFLTLAVACYGGALFRGGQFSYRDAGHYFYPLYRVVQAEWEASRWPLWDPGENSGEPLLGNPTAAVLYPGKVLYAVLPYAWGARLYVVAHTALAFLGMIAWLRSWGMSHTGAAVGGLAYAFGGPVLFQYCNVIYLVGAAWLPLGFRAADRWLRLGRRSGLVELAAVLALQTLGGDPEAAFVTGLCAGGYAVGLARFRPGRGHGALVVGVVAWVAATLALAAWLPGWRPRGTRPAPFPWMPWVPRVVLAAWACAGLVLLARWWRRGRSALGARLAGLAGAAALAAALAAAQLLPALEFTGQSARATSGGAHEIYSFSLDPVRLVEFAWPGVFGYEFQGAGYWLTAAPPVGRHARVWTPSLYLGGLTLVLAAGAAGFRGGPPGRGWLTAVAVVSLAASLGEASGPLWWARSVPAVAERVGPHDPINVKLLRPDGRLRDGDGGLYWALATFVPGFGRFRFPSKLLTVTALAVAALAGLGWDRAAAGETRRAIWVALGLLGLGLAALLAAHALRPKVLAAFARPTGIVSSFGPIDPDAALRSLRAALRHGTIAAAAALALIPRARSRLVGGLALVALTADLAVANAGLVLTVPQRELERQPEAVRVIDQAEKAEPTPGGLFRVHRMPMWSPPGWYGRSSPDRHRAIVEWERDTLFPRYGELWETPYTLTLGAAELYEYGWFFGDFLARAGPEAARTLGVEPGRPVVVQPRRAYDLWNTRYFLVPVFPRGWGDPDRSFASFLDRTERVYPAPDAFDGPGGPERLAAWIDRADFQVRRNRNVYPRAWIVHDARFAPPVTGTERSERDPVLEEMLFANDDLWRDPNRPIFDPHRLAWFNIDQRAELAGYLSGSAPSARESVAIVRYEPQRVELDVRLDQPGVVVLADVYYPGWRLTRDGVEVPVYRVNRAMRGAAVGAGRHRLVYTYRPLSFRVGGWVSLAALVAWAALALRRLR